MPDPTPPKTHTLTMTNGAKYHGFHVISTSQTKTPLELFKLGLLQSLFEVVGIPHERELKKVHPALPPTDDVLDMREKQEEFFMQETTVELTDAQRDLMRDLVKTHAEKPDDPRNGFTKIPVSHKHTNSLLAAIGLNE